MPRPAKTTIRKKDLIEATIRAIHESGAAEPTMADISSHAGLASGSIINHYFASKEELMQETYRELANGFVNEVAVRLHAVTSPVEKLHAVVTAVFAPSQTTPEAISAWLWYWSRAALEPVYGEIERKTYRKVKKELATALRRLVPKEKVPDAAEGLLALMYGLWLRFALDPTGPDAERAIRITMDMVRTQLGLGRLQFELGDARGRSNPAKGAKKGWTEVQTDRSPRARPSASLGRRVP